MIILFNVIPLSFGYFNVIFVGLAYVVMYFHPVITFNKIKITIVGCMAVVGVVLVNGFYNVLRVTLLGK